jgi:hypothetical protein
MNFIADFTHLTACCWILHTQQEGQTEKAEMRFLRLLQVRFILTGYITKHAVTLELNILFNIVEKIVE